MLGRVLYLVLKMIRWLLELNLVENDVLSLKVWGVILKFSEVRMVMKVLCVLNFLYVSLGLECIWWLMDDILVFLVCILFLIMDVYC